MNASTIGSTLVLVPALAAATTRRVPQDYPTIQAGLAAGTAGDSVLVACGTYYEHDLVMPPGIVLLSEARQPWCVTIDAGRLGRVLSCHGAGQSVIQGLTITGGELRIPTDSALGGGLYLDSVSFTLADCVIEGNHAYAGKYVSGAGGGLYATHSNLIIERCSFAHNAATGITAFGGAIAAFSTPLSVTDSGFDSNGVSADGSDGGAIEAWAPAVISRCFFRNNGCQWGRGGALNLDAAGNDISFCTFVNNGAVFGFGNALYVGASSAVDHCTFARNNFGQAQIGVQNGAPLTMSHCVVSFGQTTSIEGGVVSLSCTDVYGNDTDWTPGIADQRYLNGNFSLDPLFCNLANQDLHLQWGSPCLPQNSQGCKLVGALSYGGCASVAVEPETWGGLKAKYRGEAR